MIIPAKYGQIQPVVYEGMSFEAIVDHARRTTDDGHHNTLSLWLRGSGELKRIPAVS